MIGRTCPCVQKRIWICTCLSSFSSRNFDCWQERLTFDEVWDGFCVIRAVGESQHVCIPANKTRPASIVNITSISNCLLFQCSLPSKKCEHLLCAERHTCCQLCALLWQFSSSIAGNVRQTLWLDLARTHSSLYKHTQRLQGNTWTKIILFIFHCSLPTHAYMPMWEHWPVSFLRAK